jgi:hypothetical protein
VLEEKVGEEHESAQNEAKDGEGDEDMASKLPAPWL